jgi:hypothetical protein
MMQYSIFWHATTHRQVLKLNRTAPALEAAQHGT